MEIPNVLLYDITTFKTVAYKNLVLKHIFMSRMIVDPLTKSIGRETNQVDVTGLGLCKL